MSTVSAADVTSTDAAVAERSPPSRASDVMATMSGSAMVQYADVEKTSCQSMSRVDGSALSDAATTKPRTTTSARMKPSKSGRSRVAAARSRRAPETTKNTGWKKLLDMTSIFCSRGSLPLGKSALRMKPAAKAPSAASNSNIVVANSRNTKSRMTSLMRGWLELPAFSTRKRRKRRPPSRTFEDSR